MKREDIERADFPAARRGYDRAAVDTHLARTADELERLEASAAKTSGSLADTAGERVASVIGAAEAKAAEIEDDARRVADSGLARARSEAREIIKRAEQSVAGLIAEAEELRARIRALGDGIAVHAASAASATAAPAAETEPAIVPEPAPPEREIDPTPVIVPEPTPEPVPEPSPDPVPEPFPTPSPEPTPMPLPPQAPAAANGSPPRSSGSAPRSDGDTSGARLVAMKMALDGATRDEVSEHLASSFGLGSVDELLDDVFARAAR